MADGYNAEDEALHTAINFIDEAIKGNDKRWQGFEVKKIEEIYNTKLKNFGYVVSLSSNEKDGYMIMIGNGNKLLVTEASPEAKNPYYKMRFGKKIYNGPFAYYVTSSDKSNEIYDLRDEKYLSLDTIKQSFSYSVSYDDSTLFRLENETVFLRDYNRKFETMIQPNHYSCVSTSFAMALKYLHNVNKINLNSSMRNVETINNELFSMMNCSGKGCFTPSIGRGLELFQTNIVMYQLFVMMVSGGLI